ncbi:MAG: ribosomal L7Ae/L30e/S12e/Gadd45 family protein [Clostridia bacterium]|nr:ribosomal L7Ae/L30e/S12e/Gadd45 family protein [Clostridia bacterium]
MQQSASASGMAAGLRQTLRLIAQGRAARVFIAEDADERMRQAARQAAEAAGVPVESAESMDALRRRCRIAVPCAVAAELKED